MSLPVEREPELSLGRAGWSLGRAGPSLEGPKCPQGIGPEAWVPGQGNWRLVWKLDTLANKQPKLLCLCHRAICMPFSSEPSHIVEHVSSHTFHFAEQSYTNPHATHTLFSNQGQHFVLQSRLSPPPTPHTHITFHPRQP